MGFLAANDVKVASRADTVFGLERDRTANYLHNRPVPVVFGVGRTAAIWLGDYWGIRTKAVKQKAGKKKVAVGYNYWASFCGLICAGPVDALYQIVIDNEVVWQGAVNRNAGEDYVEVTIEDRGPLRIYWGTTAQTIDPDLAASGLVHHRYPGLCYVVAKDFFLGRDRNSVPNVELVLGRFPQSDGIAASEKVGADANPAHVLADWLTDATNGVGLDSSAIDWASFNTAATQLVNENIGISGVVTGYQTASSIIDKLLTLVGGALLQRDGKLHMDLLRGPTGAEPEVTKEHLTDEPQLTLASWSDTISAVTVKFRDQRYNYEESELSLALHDRGGKTETLDADWLTNQETAWRYAAGWGRMHAQPWLSGRLRVTAAKARELSEGALFRLTHEASGVAGLLCRVKTIRFGGPWAADVDVEFEEDRSELFIPPYAPAEDASVAPIDYTPEPLHDVRIIEAPWAVFASSRQHILFVPVRGDTRTNRCDIWWRMANGNYYLITSSQLFAWTGTLVGDYDGDVVDDVGVLIQLDGPDRGLDETSWEDAVERRALAVIGDEIVAWYDPEVIAADQYRIKLIRGRYGTARPQHSSGERIYLMYLDEPDGWPHVHFFFRWPQATFRFQEYFGDLSRELSDCDDHTIALTNRAARPLPPANLMVWSSRHPVWDGASDLSVSWDWTSRARCVSDPLVELDRDCDGARVEILDGDEVVYYHATQNNPPLTINGADVLAALGSAKPFTVRVYQYRGSYWSNPTNLTVDA